jgi:tRNA1Val (adenine37-N6)-methyltransferase
VTSPAGIVRAARRPRDWQAPGPAPAAPREIVPGPGEDLCYLCGDWRILQRTDGHRWSLDDLVTAWFAAEQVTAPPGRILDLGSGIGSVLLMLAWRFPAAVATGIEAQALSVDLARRSIAWNGAADRCRVHLGDLRDDMRLAAVGAVDLVTGTPPYLPIGTARESRRVQKGPCNFEHRGGIEAYCGAAARALVPTGVFVVCEQAAQEERVHAAAHAAGLVVTHTLPVIPRAGKPPLFAVHAMRRSGADIDPVTLLALVVRERDGTRTTDFQRVREAMGLPP